MSVAPKLLNSLPSMAISIIAPSFLCAIADLGAIPHPPSPVVIVFLPLTIRAGPKDMASVTPFFSFH